MRSLILYKPDPEIERTFRLRRKKQMIEEQRCETRRNVTNMAREGDDQRRTLRDFVTPGVQVITSSIACATIDAIYFDLEPTLISMLQQSQFEGNSFRGPESTPLDLFSGT